MKKTLQLKKKGSMSLGDAPQLVQVLAITGIVGAIMLLIITTVGANFTGKASEAIGNITLAISNFFSLTPVLGTVFIAVILLGAVALLGFAAYKRME
jgi:hypothetical protein